MNGFDKQQRHACPSRDALIDLIASDEVSPYASRHGMAPVARMQLKRAEWLSLLEKGTTYAIGKRYDQFGNPRQFVTLDNVEAMALAHFTCFEEFRRTGNKRTMGGVTKKYQLLARLTAMESSPRPKRCTEMMTVFRTSIRSR